MSTTGRTSPAVRHHDHGCQNALNELPEPCSSLLLGGDPNRVVQYRNRPAFPSRHCQDALDQAAQRQAKATCLERGTAAAVRQLLLIVAPNIILKAAGGYSALQASKQCTELLPILGPKAGHVKLGFCNPCKPAWRCLQPCHHPWPPAGSPADLVRLSTQTAT